ncbi:MAG: DUF4238 domain-containing protein [Solirubrobacteraceae bacterium]|nr:DUF4238 domain-containing protein [Solirubrobacteraceae bacterium]
MNGTPKKQHYVPQVLLRNFAFGKNEQVHVYDKQTRRTWKAAVRDVASENYFYDWDSGDGTKTVEDYLGTVETAAGPVIEKILQLDSLALSEGEQAIMSAFLAVQMTRTRAAKERLVALSSLLIDRLGGEKLAPDIEHFLEALKDQNALNEQFSGMVRQSVDDYSAHFLNKGWMLVSTSTEDPFYIGDSPVALQNRNKREGPWSNLGLAVEGIEIHFPLSTTRGLTLLCPTHVANIKRAGEQRDFFMRFAPSRLKALKDEAGVGCIAKALNEGALMPMDASNVRNFNSLQVAFAERFVFSATPDFALVAEMLDNTSSNKRGPKWTPT